MTSVPPPAPLEQARELLEALEAPAGAKRRVLAGIEAEGGFRRSYAHRKLLAVGVFALVGGAAAAELSGLTQVLGGAPDPNPGAPPPVSVDHGSANRSQGEASALSEGGATPLVDDSVDSEEVAQRSDDAASPADARHPSPAERGMGSRQTLKRAAVSVPPPPEPSELAQQVRAYRRALSWAKRDDERLLKELRAFKARWPQSPFTQEVELESISALSRLGRQSDGRRAARRFVEEHPTSDKAREIQSVLEGRP